MGDVAFYGTLVAIVLVAQAATAGVLLWPRIRQRIVQWRADASAFSHLVDLMGGEYP